MIYHDFGNTGIQVSAIGFGTMRWLSEQACGEIIHRGLELGINYIDTGSGYVGGDSEKWVGAALAGRRGDIFISAKSRWDRALSADETRREIDERLKVMGLDYLDFYQIWGLGRVEVAREVLAPGGMAEGIARARADGLVRYGLGFTFHGPEEAFKAAIDTGAFVTATVSYNLLSRKDGELIDYAAERGLAMVVMNPNAGGVLAMAGEPALDFLCGDGAGPTYGALRFLLANPNIATSIIGFTDVAEVDQAVGATDGVDALGEEFRQDLIEKMDAVDLVRGDFCTACGYCKECPNGFDPTHLMKAMRDFALYRVADERLGQWLESKYPGKDVATQLAKCTECGECEPKCPQGLKIVESIRRTKSAVK